MACPMMFLHTALLMKFPFLPAVLFIRLLFGASVANASAPSVSMIMLTQSNRTAVRGALPSSKGRSHEVHRFATLV